MSADQPKRGTLKLDEARAITPPVSPVEAMRRQLQLALFDGVKEQDVLTLANKLKEMALAGDLKAMKMFFELVVGKEPKAAPPPSDGQGLKMMAEALQDLVDEIRVTKAREAKRIQHVGHANGSHDEGE
jgi:hypothetical protein